MAATATGTDVSGSAATGTVYNGFGNGGAAATTTDAGGASTSSPTSTAKSGAQAALTIGRSYGVMVIATGLFAGFALVI